MTTPQTSTPQTGPRVILLWDCDDTVLSSEKIAMPMAIEILMDHFGAEELAAALAPTALGEDSDQSSDLVSRVTDKLVEGWTGRHFTAMIDDCHGAINARRSPGQQLPKLSKGLRTELIQRNVDRAREGMRHVQVIPGINEALATFAERQDHVNAIVTSSEFGTDAKKERVWVGLESTGLLPVFDGGVFSASTLGVPNKPEPDIYDHAKEALGFRPGVDIVIAIEDSVSGVRSAFASGVPVVGTVATDNLSTQQDKSARAQELRSHGAKTVVFSGEDLVNAIDRQVALEMKTMYPDYGAGQAIQ